MGNGLFFRIVQQKIMLVLGVPRGGVGPGGKLKRAVSFSSGLA